MPAILSIIVSNANSELIFEGGGHRRALTLKRHPQSRSFRLKVDPRDGRVLLSLPQRASLAKAHRWAESQRDWVETQLADLPEPRPILPNGTLPYRGTDLRIDHADTHPRKPVLEDDHIRVGGPVESLTARLIRWLKDEARKILTEESARYALAAEVTIGRISIGDARSRWGSCASSGNIRYSWRLVMAPPDVLSATVAHEVAHRVHMHHGPEFHAVVAELFGREPRAERRWLRDHGAALYWVGASS